MLVMQSKDGRIFKVGDMVMLHTDQPAKDHHGLLTVNYARIKSFMDQSEYPGGIKLDRSLGCHNYWNASDLIVLSVPPVPVAELSDNKVYKDLK